MKTECKWRGGERLTGVGVISGGGEGVVVVGRAIRIYF